MPLYDFSEEPNFTGLIGQLFGTDENFSAFQAVLNTDPRKGAVIQGTGGVRKVRYRDLRRGMGTRGGIRIIYLFLEQYEVILLIAGYTKEIPDLTPAQKQIVKRLAENYSEECRTRNEIFQQRKARR